MFKPRYWDKSFQITDSMIKRLLVFALTFFIGSSVYAQKVSYPQLVNRSEAPRIFIDEMILPGADDNVNLAFIFRFNYDFLPFKKLSFEDEIKAPDNAGFYTILRLNSEIFEGSDKEKLASVKAASRDVWADTLFAETFEQTQSRDMHASGSMITELNPGLYNFVLQLSTMQETNERSTQRKNIRLDNLSEKKTGEIYLTDALSSPGTSRFPLLNMDDNVPFGKDFGILFRIPGAESAGDYQIEIKRVRPGRKDTTAMNSVYTQELSAGDLFSNSTIRLQPGSNPALELIKGEGGLTYGYVTIPASSFDNAAYTLLIKDAEDKPLARKFFKSYWPDMPASLYNLDIAINNLKFIVGEKELDKLRDGNDKEKKEKFDRFWASKDPTPDTVYNELMAEYYRRIDYAFKTFGSTENPMGHENDQGKIYIKFGPPDTKKRLFPTDDKVREIWTYGNRTFVFETGSGFGDFVLKGTQ